MKATPTARALDPAAAVWLSLDVLRPNPRNPRNPRAHGAEVRPVGSASATASRRS